MLSMRMDLEKLGLQTLNVALSVRSVMTPDEELLCWNEGDDLEGAARLGQEEGFDVLPVRRSGQIDQLLHISDRSVHRLRKDDLVSADTSIPALLRIFKETAGRPLLIISGQAVAAIEWSWSHD